MTFGLTGLRFVPDVPSNQKYQGHNMEINDTYKLDEEDIEIININLADESRSYLAFIDFRIKPFGTNYYQFRITENKDKKKLFLSPPWYNNKGKIEKLVKFDIDDNWNLITEVCIKEYQKKLKKSVDFKKDDY